MAMFPRKINITRDGTTYTYLKIVESYRAKGKTRQRVLLNFGNIANWPPEKLKKVSEQIQYLSGISNKGGLSIDDIDPREALDYGPHLLADTVWEKLSLSQFWVEVLSERDIEFEVEMAIKAMVYNRLTSPLSKLGIDEWLKKLQFIPGVSSEKVKVHHYYRALDVLEEYKDRLERWIFDRITNLLNWNLSLVFYDLTSSYFEGSGPDLACDGYSREHRPDCEQIQIGLLVNSDGIPIAHIVFDGAVHDQKTLPDILREMKSSFNIKRCILVADDGILNTDTMDCVKGAGFESIFSASMGKEKFVQDVLISLPPLDTRSDDTKGPWKKVKDNLWVFELPERIEGRRVVITFNPLRQRSQRKKRQERIEKTIEYLSSFNLRTKRGARKNTKKVERQIDRWLTKKKTGKYFTYSRKAPYHLEYTLVEKVIEKENRTDGMMVLRTDAENLDATEIALGYRTLTQVEHAFREIKNFIRLRPIRHHTDNRVKAHVAVCVLAYLIESLLDKLFEDAGLKITACRALKKLAPLRAVKLEVGKKHIFKTTTPSKEQLNLLKLAGLKKIERIIPKP